MTQAMAYVCQGCGQAEEDVSRMSPRGIVNEKLYCERCVALVDEYTDQRDELHTHLAKEWNEELAALALDYGTQIKRLPDGG